MNWQIVFDVCVVLWCALLHFESYDTRKNYSLKKKVKSKKSKK